MHEVTWNFEGKRVPVEIERGREGGTRILSPFRHSGICEGLAFRPVYLVEGMIGFGRIRSRSCYGLKGRALPHVRR